jgi:hypothetical protein|tara:strand:- start:404 stop:841 length:438 start_codon:yes stop_codon:yes gene_type:complete
MNNIEKNIAEWIDYLSMPQDKLNGSPVCPFAKKAKYKIIDLADEEVLNPDFSTAEVILYIVDGSYSFEQVEQLSIKYNKQFPNLVFLPDSKHRHSHINGVQSNNDKYNLILCQERSGLQAARDRLSQTLYYTHWDENYLKEILAQ